MDTALAVFGSRGFSAATTRQIAETAGTNLPGLTYYFGNKEGLYLACAHEIAASFRQGVGAVAEVAAASLSKPDGNDATLWLKRLFAALAHFLLSEEGAEDRALFVQREMASPGPAFEILYSELWRPGIELAAALIERAAAGSLSRADSQVRAVMMIASLTGFRSGQRIIARATGGADHVEQVIAALDAQIDAL
ncbi:CerR family C-terminal domain-containing protein [Sphingopyxis sp.]|uniref:CerR family C-terminal domain-containing protein n=1 Tax=Sphingopyxis sp. TaxID=1908224 RepID=UPI0035B4C9C3